jgi:hypothetical protein
MDGLVTPRVRVAQENGALPLTSLGWEDHPEQSAADEVQAAI